MKDKTCNTCVSRLLCPLRGYRQVCDGYNDEDVFWGFLYMMFPQLQNAFIKIRESLKEMQKIRWEKMLRFII